MKAIAFSLLGLCLVSSVACGGGSSSSCLVNLGSDSDGAYRQLDYSSDRGYAQSFQISSDSTVSTVSLRLKRVGTDFTTGDTLTVAIYSDSSGPSSSLASVTWSYDAMNEISTSTAAYYSFTLDSSASLSASTTYWVVLEGGYSPNTSYYLEWYGDSTNTYDSGEGMERNSSTWAEVPDSSGSTSLKDFLIRVGC